MPIPASERLKVIKPQATEYILARVYNQFTAGHIEIIRNEICNQFFGALVEDKVKKNKNYRILHIFLKSILNNFRLVHTFLYQSNVNHVIIRKI